MRAQVRTSRRRKLRLLWSQNQITRGETRDIDMDLYVSFPVAIGISFEQVICVVKLAGDIGECGVANIDKGLIARGMRIAVDARQVDVIALGVREVGDLV